jgi:transposase
MTVRVTEHQLIARRCRGGATTCGTAPEGVTAPVQYGPQITAIVLYLYVGLYVGQFLSKKRTAAALAELFGTPLCEGTVTRMTKRAAEGLDEFPGQVTDRIAASEVAGFDETGLRVAGRLHWVHSRPHRQVHPDHLPPPTWAQGPGQCRRPRPVPWCRGARRLGAV